MCSLEYKPDYISSRRNENMQSWLEERTWLDVALFWGSVSHRVGLEDLIRCVADQIYYFSDLSTGPCHSFDQAPVLNFTSLYPAYFESVFVSYSTVLLELYFNLRYRTVRYSIKIVEQNLGIQFSKRVQYSTVP